ncbi:RrF2 family transcriptional regulator [Thomasclavelia sp.]
MKISTKGRYALRIMLDIAMHDDGKFIPLKDIAKRQELTIKYLEQIISLLNKAGYLQSLRGNAGGYRLTKRPEEYIVGDILRITEGDLAPIACLKENSSFCLRSNECLTLPFWQGLDKVIKEYVDGITLQDLITQANSQINNYSI